MNSNKPLVCPVALAGHLDGRLRKLLHNPRKLLKPFIKEGDTVLDLGCGPGFFTLPMAMLTGKRGRVIAADLQQGMLDMVKRKAEHTDLQERIVLHKCEENGTGIREQVDFILLFYMVHEVPDQKGFFIDMHMITKPNGSILVVEPPVHVSKKAFRRTLETAEEAGFTVLPGPGLMLDKTALLTKGH